MNHGLLRCPGKGRVSASEDRLAGRYLQGFKWSVQVQQQQRENASRVGKREARVSRRWGRCTDHRRQGMSEE